jgi:hypothetical protein
VVGLKFSRTPSPDPSRNPLARLVALLSLAVCQLGGTRQTQASLGCPNQQLHLESGKTRHQKSNSTGFKTHPAASTH